MLSLIHIAYLRDTLRAYRLISPQPKPKAPLTVTH